MKPAFPYSVLCHLIKIRSVGISILLFCCLSVKAQQTNSEKAINQPKIEFEQALKTTDIVKIAHDGYKLADYYSGLGQFDKTVETYKTIASYAHKLQADSIRCAAKHAESYIYFLTSEEQKCQAICNELISSPKTPIEYVASAKYMQAQFLTNASQFESSNKKLVLCIEVFKDIKDTLALAECHRLYGNNFRHLSQLESAISHYISALNLLESKNSYLVINIYFSLINLYIEQNNMLKATEYLNRVDKYSDVIPNEKQLQRIALLKAQIYFANGQYESAHNYVTNALNYFIKHNIDQYKFSCFLLLIKENLREGNITNAAVYLDSINKYTSYISNDQNWFKYYIAKSRVLVQQHNYDQSAKALSHAKNKINFKSDLKHSSLYHNAMSNFYKIKNENKKALEHLAIVDTLKNLIFNQEQALIINELETKHRKAQLAKEIKELNLEKETTHAQLKQQKLSLQFSILGLLILGIFSYCIFYFYKKLKIKNNQLEKAYSEKDILLREIHHRVKNNLQVISSLLALQSKYIKDDSALSALKQGQDRVYSMALIHQDLYQSNNLKGVNSKDYFEHLIDNLFDSYNIDEDNIELIFDVDSILLDVDTMIPLGLVMNELVSNALKHAFKNQIKGKINVSLKKREDCLILKVSDNGKSVEDINKLHGESFGFQLINAFAKKLKASVDIGIKDGLSIELKIKNYITAA